MGYRTLRECVDALAATGQIVCIEEPVDARLEAAEIHRRVYQAGGPAIYFANIVGCRFPMVSNLFGTIGRARYLFRDTLNAVRRLVELKADSAAFWKQPTRYLPAGRLALAMRPRQVRTGPILANQTTIGQLPQQVSWPDDGGAFITLPQVYTEHADHPGLGRSNLGMYRVQLSGGQYKPDHEVGLHYQIHRTIGVHHEAALRRGVPFRVNVFVGGPPAMMLAAVMPLPENVSELAFAGALGGHRVPMIVRDGELAIHAQTDFCITGVVDPERRLPEGPFGDHLGYYSLTHDFPVLRVENVYHRDGAIWPFTVVGRPPQEDTIFGRLIHEITGPLIPTVIPGVHAVHAVDAAGVHPLLLAIGSERYTPHGEVTRPQELLTQANAILGQGQLSLAKYLWLAAKGDDPQLDIHDVSAFLQHVLARVEWGRDLHFHTCTTMDTLDYSGTGLNEGSKLVIAAVGAPRRELATQLPSEMRLPEEFRNPHLVLPGLIVLEGPPCDDDRQRQLELLERLCSELDETDVQARGVALVVVVDNSEFAARTVNNFLWVTFTRSNPALDVHGAGAFVADKHWGCRGPLVIDARSKPHHAPPLVPDPEVTRRVDRLAARGGPLHGIL
ncbi:MAG: UbiD family decarboxylase [Pirellulales bacterium]